VTRKSKESRSNVHFWSESCSFMAKRNRPNEEEDTMKKEFPWGQVIASWSLNFDGYILNIVKYHPNVFNENGHSTGEVDMGKELYSCPEMHRSSKSLEMLIINAIAIKKVGVNSSDLVSGIGRALNLV
jgi:hypothetical protein